MSKIPAFVIGIILSFLGLIIFLPNSNASGPEAYEELYWAFGGCLLSLTGMIVIIVASLWPRKSIDLNSNETGNEVSIPPPVLVDRDRNFLQNCKDPLCIDGCWNGTHCLDTSQRVMSGATLHIMFWWKGNPSDQ